jgi:hypothetical protein
VYYDALMNPDLIPANSENNIDLKCNFKTMFKTIEDQE